MVMGLFWHLVQKELASVKVLEVLGKWGAFMLRSRQPSRNAFGILGRTVSGHIPLQQQGPLGARELRVAMGLFLLMQMDLRVPVDPAVAGTSASEAGGAAALSTGLSEADWPKLGEGERSPQQGHPDAIRLEESLSNIRGARRALELPGFTPAVPACSKKDTAARQVSAAAFPGGQHCEGVRYVTRKVFLGCVEKEIRITVVLHLGGLLCLGSSSLNAGQTGIEDQRSPLVCEENRIDGELALAFPLAATHSGGESEPSMNKNDKQAVAKVRYGCPPDMCCLGPLS